jgi:hypothetical protein
MTQNETKQCTKLEAANLRKELQASSQISNEAWWRQCELLHQVYYSGIGDELKPIYQLWGYESFHDYVETELGLHIGTANAMVRTAHFFVVRMQGAFLVKHHLLSRQRMRALASHPDKVDKKNLNNWVTQARNMTVCALEHKLDGRKEHVKTFSFSFSPSEHAIVKEAIDELMATGEYGSRGEALIAILRPKNARKIA